MEGWYYVPNDSKVGPVGTGEIELLISQSSIFPHTLVWREGMRGWEEAGSHFAFPGGLKEPPPIPRRATAAGPAAALHATAGAGYGAGSYYPGAPSRGFGEAISVCLRNYFTFSGRASRSEYWYFFLFVILVWSSTASIYSAIFVVNDVAPVTATIIASLFMPGIAVAIRRLHDTDRSGWWVGGYWVGLIIATGIGQFVTSVSSEAHQVEVHAIYFFLLGTVAFIYFIVLLVFCSQRGTPRQNRFG